MGDYAPPHLEYLEGVANDPEAAPGRRELAGQMLMFGSSSPRYDLPRPATGPELVAAVMMVEAHLAAADLGINLGEHLIDVLYFAGEPEHRAQCIAYGGSGDLHVSQIAEAMLEAGRYAAQRLGDASVADAALRKLEAMPCPTCGRAFGEFSPDD